VDETVELARKQELEDGGLASEFADTFMSFRRGGKERAAPPLPIDDQERKGLAEEVVKLGGLFILGTERHESRRIDNQLRGRAGRQGDPGESRFFVSLEDQLWKIFNPKMMENPILRAWPTMEEVRAKFITGMILKTQERIENHFFIHGAWLEEGQLLRDAPRLQGLPGTIVHGRYDMPCPARYAWELSKVWTDAELFLVEGAGHAYSEPGILDRLIHATDKLADSGT